MSGDSVRFYKALDGSLRPIDLKGCPEEWVLYKQSDWAPDDEYPRGGLVEHRLFLTGDGHYVSYQYLFECRSPNEDEWFPSECVEYEEDVANRVLWWLGEVPPGTGVDPSADPRWVACVQRDLANAIDRCPNTKFLFKKLREAGVIQDIKDIVGFKHKKLVRIDDPDLRRKVLAEVAKKKRSKRGKAP
jgi:hypothetical protein